VKVVAIADAHGVVANPGGLDVERLLLTRDAFGAVDRRQLRPQDTEADGDTWLDIECDVLVPAAISYCVTPADQHRITARVIAEAANMPVLPEAEAALHARGVTVLPDFVVNSATNAWWWWTLFGDIGADSDEAHAMVRAAMRQLTGNMLNSAEARGVTPRHAAQAVVEHNLTAIEATFT
jgi:glutamate dehydrogenase (NAD(P)+)